MELTELAEFVPELLDKLMVVVMNVSQEMCFLEGFDISGKTHHETSYSFQAADGKL